MALVKTVLVAAIEAALNKQAGKTAEGDDPKDSVKEFAADLADAIDVYIKSGTVNSTVVGTSPSGPVTGTAVGTIS